MLPKRVDARMLYGGQGGGKWHVGCNTKKQLHLGARGESGHGLPFLPERPHNSSIRIRWH